MSTTWHDTNRRAEQALSRSTGSALEAGRPLCDKLLALGVLHDAAADGILKPNDVSEMWDRDERSLGRVRTADVPAELVAHLPLVEAWLAEQPAIH